jgi:hypothetical protein
MKEEFSILAANADTKTRRYVERTKLALCDRSVGLPFQGPGAWLAS